MRAPSFDRRRAVLAICIALILILLPIQATHAQSAVSPQRTRGNMGRASTPTVFLEQQVLKTSPDETRVLSSTMNPIPAAGTTHTILTIKGAGELQVSATLIRAFEKGVRLRIRVSDVSSRKTLTEQELSLATGEGASIELAESPSRQTRVALRFIPSLIVADPVEEYTGYIERFGVTDGILILNLKEIISRGSAVALRDNRNPRRLQYLSIEHPAIGRIRLSYRRFPGSMIRGFVQGQRMVFDWKGDLLEWISTGEIILPEGVWALFVAPGDETEPVLGPARISAGLTDIEQRQ
ncbi:MAG: hypothetical protein HXY20_03395 [Acidobacteria bacterium]|nr:hypothetical protein [Acidobacteriota bacterium]